MNKFCLTGAALALAGCTLLSACGGGGGGSEAAGTAVAGYNAENSSVKPGIAYPFGSQLTAYVAGIKPTVESQSAQNAVIRRQYDQWKANGVQDRCGGAVVVFNSQYATVSEGAGYGMLLTVVMAGYDGEARALFNKLFHVVRASPAYGANQPALMEWRLNADCSSAGEGWGAMDGDLDIAMALLMADKQWGSTGEVNYRAEALKTIAAIKSTNMSPAGFTKGLPNASNNRTSDYMITHFKAFKRATGDTFWDEASDRAFDLLNLMQDKFAPNTGLVPDFIINTATNPEPSTGYIGDGNDREGSFYTNACRLPWRLASDYVTSGDERSKKVTTRMMNFFESSTGGQPAQIQAGYQLDGTSMGNYSSPSFTGPATAGAIVDEKFQPFLNSLWTHSSTNLADNYYDTELQLLSMIVVSGNWWNP